MKWSWFNIFHAFHCIWAHVSQITVVLPQCAITVSKVQCAKTVSKELSQCAITWVPWTSPNPSPSHQRSSYTKSFDSFFICCATLFIHSSFISCVSMLYQMCFHSKIVSSGVAPGLIYFALLFSWLSFAYFVVIFILWNVRLFTQARWLPLLAELWVTLLSIYLISYIPIVNI